MSSPMNRAIAGWLLVGCGLIALMVSVGGVTRLTGSGLSITEWDLLMGVLPPLSTQDWEVLFTKYRQTPQFQQVNPHFTLAEFQQIFWWEYLHRLLGRLLGVVFLVPFLWFLLRGALNRPLRNRVLLVFLLGAFQGALGWFMVASGLVDRPSVSHYRLAAHLLLAFLTFGLTLWVALGVMAGPGPGHAVPPALRRLLTAFGLLFAMQVVYGGFVAGLRAGYMFNTFPGMGGGFIPPGLWLLDSTIRNLTANPVTVQFVHRMLAWALLASGGWLWYSLRLHGVRGPAHLFLATLMLQFGLGVLAVLRLPLNPLLWGPLHQAGALALLAAFITLRFSVRQPRSGLVADAGLAHAT